MKKLFKKSIFLFLLMVISIIGVTNVNAQGKNIEVTDITIKDKTGTITVAEPTLSDGKINSEIKFNKVGDYVTFEVTLKNIEEDKYKITSITDNNENENIDIEYTYDKDFIEKDKTSKVTIKMTYKNKLVNKDISLDDLSIILNLEKEDGSSSQITINPQTGDNILRYVALFIMSGLGLFFVITKKRIKGFKVGNLLLIISVILIPFTVLANEKYELSIKFTNIEVKGEFEVYNITIDPKDGSPIVIKEITYGQPIGELPENLEKDGYEFDKWVDDAGNEITEETIITGPIEIEAKFNVIKYDISYNLNGGSLPSGKANPNKYTIESNDITLNNPSKDGYTFKGWSGTGLTGDTNTAVTIATGSTGDKEYTAHWTKDTYTITYELNGGTNASSYPSTYQVDTDTITLAEPTKTGYTFKGWSGTGLTGNANTAVTIATGSTGDRSYTANWTPNTYTIKFHANGGEGRMSDQSMTYGVSSNLRANAFTKEKSTLKEWNSKDDGTGDSYTDKQSVINLTNENNGIINLYAQWEPQPTKYAVQIYGINQDVDSSGNTLGLTFGPATGADYNNAYVTHEYEEIAGNPGIYNVKIVTHTVDSNGRETTSSTYLTNSSGNKVTRTQEQVTARENISLHDMTWAQIAAVGDKTVFEDSMLCGDTKSVSLTLNSTIGSGSVYNQYGDGAGALVKSINEYYRRWNPNPSENSYVGTGVTLDSNETYYGSNARNAGGYSASHIRATLIGENTKTNKGYAGDMNLSSDTSLYSCIADDLKAVITPKKIRYATGTSSSSFRLNDDISDSIWLFSDREMYGTGRYSGSSIEGLGSGGDGYARFSNTESKYYMSSYNDDVIKVKSVYLRKVYNEDSTLFSSWSSRSVNLDYTASLRGFTFSGGVHGVGPHGDMGVSFGFCIR